MLLVLISSLLTWFAYALESSYEVTEGPNAYNISSHNTSRGSDTWIIDKSYLWYFFRSSTLFDKIEKVLWINGSYDSRFTGNEVETLRIKGPFHLSGVNIKEKILKDFYIDWGIFESNQVNINEIEGGTVIKWVKGGPFKTIDLDIKRSWNISVFDSDTLDLEVDFIWWGLKLDDTLNSDFYTSYFNGPVNILNSNRIDLFTAAWFGSPINITDSKHIDLEDRQYSEDVNLSVKNSTFSTRFYSRNTTITGTNARGSIRSVWGYNQYPGANKAKIILNDFSWFIDIADYTAYTISQEDYDTVTFRDRVFASVVSDDNIRDTFIFQETAHGVFGGDVDVSDKFVFDLVDADTGVVARSSFSAEDLLLEVEADGFIRKWNMLLDLKIISE